MSVEDVAAALRANGIVYDVSETAALSGIRGQGIRLTGRDLAVEIYRLDDLNQMQAASSAVGTASEANAPGRAQHRPPSPLRCYVRPPFLVVVHREPADGEVAAVLAKVLGD